MLHPLSDQDSGYGDIIEPPTSLWRLVEDLVPGSERAEVKRILGEAAVDLSLDLYGEIEVLLELWRDVRSMGPCSHHRPLSSCSVLADPPAIKAMVTQEIRMLLLSVRRTARHRGLDEDQALSKYNPKVVSFVMGAERPESGARSRRGGSSLGAGDERPFSALSTDSSIGDELEELKDKLQISDIDEVVLHLQSLLEDECRTLEKHITILQLRLEEEHLDAEDVRTPLPEPSLTELKEERRIIERDLQLDQLSATSVQSSKMAATRMKHPARLLDNGRKSSLGTQSCRLSQKRPTSSGLQQSEATLAPCPPDPRLKVADKEKMSKLSAVLGIPCATSLSLTGPGEVPGLEATRKPTNVSGIAQSRERISHNSNKGPPAAPSVISSKPSNLNYLHQPRLGGSSLDTVFVPVPPPVQKRTNSSSAPTFRRVRTQLPS
ncbi:coiled-coil domain-containing protein 24 [Mixophyes fleayi]|uniref:coiled-coil domain-containing protein 24 n=1 Tax=Mixophyes fleayi TaxID=3061075 RepID=UPI003F4DA61B